MNKIVLLFILSLPVSVKGFSQTSPAEPQMIPAPALTAEDSIFSKVEFEATFPGGAGAFKRYLETYLDAEVPIKRKAAPGTYTVIIKFIVGKDGRIADIKAETNNGYGMEEEVIRLIKKSPNWIPARVNGRAVNAYRRQPVVFSVEK